MNEYKEKAILKLKEMTEKELGKAIAITEKTRNNGVKKTYFYLPELRLSGKPTPIISVDDGIDAILDGEITINEAVRQLVGHFKKSLDFEFEEPTVEQILEGVQFELINVEKNKEKLEQVPYLLFWDMAATYRAFLTEAHSFLISNKVMEKMGLTSKQLEEAAKKNIKKTEYCFKSIVDILAESMEKDGLEVPASMIETMKKDAEMYVLRGKYPNGASFLMFPEIFEDFADEKEADLYIIPSSLCELIVLPVTVARGSRDLKEVVKECNGMIEEDIVLCDHVFKYSRKYKNITIAK